MSEGLEKSRSHKLGGLINDVQQADTQSQNDFMALGKKNTNITMDSGLPTGSGGGTRYSKHLSERSNRIEPFWLNLTKKLEITVHQVKIQISSRIDLQLFC